MVAFGILGIFSATHRKIALEAFDCVFKKVRLKPCDSGLDKRLKSKATGKLMKRNPKLARFIYQHFEAISGIFTVLLIVSMVYSGLGIYNFVVYSNCNGEESQEMCIYEGLVGSPALSISCESPLCQNTDCMCENEIDCQEKTGDACLGSCYIKGD